MPPEIYKTSHRPGLNKLKRILLVDDQAHVLRVIKLSLDRNGFEVDTALSGDTALAMLKSAGAHASDNRHYDVLITDADMPGMNGMALCESVYREFSHGSPLMFIVGEDGDTSLSEWAGKHRGTELLEKPISLGWLVSRLDEHFGHYDKQVATGR